MINVLVNIVYYSIVPIVLYYFFCKYCNIPFLLKQCFCYVLCYIVLCYIQLHSQNQYHIFFSILHTTLMVCYGTFLKKAFSIQFVLFAIFLNTIFSVCNGFTRTILFCLLCHITNVAVIQYGDMIQILVTILFTILLLSLIYRYFFKNMAILNSLYLIIMPIFFISIVETVISNDIYGNTIVMDNQKGIVFPIVNHSELFFLYFVAFCCIFTSLILYRNMTKAIYQKQTIQLLQQQNNMQQIYMKEAQSRYEQTRSFRHDIQNHLTVLFELLKQNENQKAYQYLYHLEEISKNLSFAVQTGNVVINTLLSSKFAVAKQKEIAIDCDIKVPENIQEINWCIILANAIDNAITESSLIEQKQNRCILVKGVQKGNFYMISVKNRCREQITQVPEWGIGLHNINAVCQKYNGTMHIEIKNSFYCLNVLLVIPQP